MVHHYLVVNQQDKKSVIHAFGLPPGKIDMSELPPELHQDLRYVIKVAVGDAHAVFLLGNYQIMVCGSNQSGQLGLSRDEVPDRLDVPKIVPVRFEAQENVNVCDIACGRNHTLMLVKVAGEAKRLMGCGCEMGLGLGDLQDKFVPTLQSVAEGFVIDKIYASFNRSLAINDEGQVYIWGEDFTNERIDVPKLLHDFKQKLISFAVGYLHGLAVTSNTHNKFNHSRQL